MSIYCMSNELKCLKGLSTHDVINIPILCIYFKSSFIYPNDCFLLQIID